MKIVHDQQKILSYRSKLEALQMLSTSFQPHMNFVMFDKHEFLYHQEDEMNYLYIFMSGKVKVSYLSSNGKETIFRFITQPRIIGEMELILDNNGFTDVEVVEESLCFILPLQTYREALLNDVVFLQHCSFNMAEALILSNNQFSINQNFSPKSRVISYILSIAQHEVFYFDYKTVSNIIGISERHIFRIIRELLQDQFIEKHEKYFRILKQEELENFAGDTYIVS